MFARNSFSILAFALPIAFALPAQAQVTLQKKVLENKTSTLDTNTKLEQKLTIAGMDVETGAETHSSVKITTGKRDDAGRIKVEEKVTAMQIQVKTQGMEYLFDSANPDKTGASALEFLRKVHQVQARRKTTQIFDKDNKLEAIEFDEDALVGLDDNVKGLVKDQFDTEKLKKAAHEETARIPSTPISKGDSWEHTSKTNVGAGQVMTFVTQYTYEGEVDKAGRKLDKISAKVKSVDLALEDSPLPLAIKSTALKPAESKEEILFDRELGRVAESSSQISIKGDIVFTANGMELPSKLDLKIETNSTRKE